MKKIILTLISLVLIGCQAQQSSNWRLTSGTLPFSDPSPLVFEGSVELEGWLVYKSAYVEGQDPHFHVINVENLPAEFNFKTVDFLIHDEQIISQLKDSAQAVPAKVKATKITVNMEGSPVMEISEIL